MKKYLYIFVLCALSVSTLVGCKKDPEKEPQKEPETFVSNVERPTWRAVEVPDMTSSMTAVIKVDLKAQYPDHAADFVLDDNDLLAAYQGEICTGIADLQDGLFYLYIAGVNDEPITLRYYSAHYKNQFEAKDAFPFVNDDHLGTVAAPYIPAFVVIK